MLDLFVTHDPQSEGDIRGLLEDLKALGDTACFEAQRGSGLGWWEQTLARIRSCDALLFALTPQTLESEACWREMRYAHALGKPVLAIELSERTDLGATPSPLDTLPFVSFRRRDRDSALRLCKALRSIRKAVPLPRVLPVPPGLPPSYLAGLRDLIATRGKLDAGQQNRLIADLAESLRELHSAFEARQLLLALRQRRDLAAGAVAEIDGLLRKTAATQFKLRPPPGPHASAMPRQSLVPPAPAGQQRSPRAAQAPRRLAAKPVAASLAGLASCTAAGCLLASGAHQEQSVGSLRVGSIELPGVEVAALLVMLAAGVAATWQVAARWARSG